MIYLYLLLAANAGFLAGWIAASEYHWRASRKIMAPTLTRRDEHGS